MSTIFVNYVKFEGDESEIANIQSEASTRDGSVPRWQNGNFSIACILGESGADDAWREEHWGVPFDVGRDLITQRVPGVIEFEFETRGGFPIAALQRISKKYMAIKITCHFSIFDVMEGTLVLLNGETISEEICSADDPEYVCSYESVESNKLSDIPDSELHFWSGHKWHFPRCQAKFERRIAEFQESKGIPAESPIKAAAFLNPPKQIDGIPGFFFGVPVDLLPVPFNVSSKVLPSEENFSTNEVGSRNVSKVNYPDPVMPFLSGLFITEEYPNWKWIDISATQSLLVTFHYVNGDNELRLLETGDRWIKFIQSYTGEMTKEAIFSEISKFELKWNCCCFEIRIDTFRIYDGLYRWTSDGEFCKFRLDQLQHALKLVIDSMTAESFSDGVISDSGEMLI